MASYPIDTQTMRHFCQRSDAFFDGMKLLRDDPDSYREAPALLAVHGAISLTDAIRVCYTGKWGVAEDHREAAQQLRRLCGRLKADNTGVSHLTWLLSRKDAFAYREHRVDRNDIETACTHAERFEAWVARTFQEVVRGRSKT